nr:hypothetical protein [Tanacetum cinerariifolium]
MGGSLSQPRTDPPVSSINAFLLGDLYTPQLSDSFLENTGYWKQTNLDDSPVEQVATSSTKKKKNATRNRRKRMNQAEPAPRQTAWTNEEEIALAKGWRSVSENSEREGRDKVKNKRSKASGSSTMNDDALARLMVTEMTATEVAQREQFMELKMREVECRVLYA